MSAARVLSEHRAAGSAGQSRADLPEGFTSDTAVLGGAKLHYVRGGEGPLLMLIHGFPQDWFEYRAILPRLAQRFTVLAADLRGIGGSEATQGGYDAATMAGDIEQLLASIEVRQGVYVVGHDIGGQVAYALLRRRPQLLRGAMILDTTLPGVAGWDESLSGPGAWHVGFMQVPGLAEKLVAGRQADYLGYFFSFSRFTPAERDHYARAYASESQQHAAFEMYRAFPANAAFNASQRTANEVPLLLAAGEKSPFASLLPKIAVGLRAAGCGQVNSAIIPGAVHYDVQDQPDATAALIEQHAGSQD